MKKEQLSPSEAVYGFAGWLTSRDKRTIMSANDDATPIADLANEFCKANNLEEPREDWSENLKHPY